MERQVVFRGWQNARRAEERAHLQRILRPRASRWESRPSYSVSYRFKTEWPSETDVQPKVRLRHKSPHSISIDLNPCFHSAYRIACCIRLRGQPVPSFSFLGHLSLLSTCLNPSSNSIFRLLLWTLVDDPEPEDFETTAGVKVVPTFEQMGLKEDLLRGVYAYSTLDHVE